MALPHTLSEQTAAEQDRRSCGGLLRAGGMGQPLPGSSFCTLSSCPTAVRAGKAQRITGRGRREVRLGWDCMGKMGTVLLPGSTAAPIPLICSGAALLHMLSDTVNSKHCIAGEQQVLCSFIGQICSATEHSTHWQDREHNSGQASLQIDQSIFNLSRCIWEVV